MSGKDSLAKWVTPEIPEQRVQRMWSNIDEADRARGWPRWAIASVALSALLAVALTVSLVTRPSTLKQGAEVSAVSDPTLARFSDGSTAELGPNSALSLELQRADLVEVKLHEGTATFEVAKKPARQFIVQARDVRVRVVGTRFTVNDRDGVVEVSVERGIVEVVRGAETQRLTAGQSWHSTALAEAEEVDEADDEVEAPDAPSQPSAPAEKKKVKRTRKAAPPAPVVAAPPAAPAEDAFQTALTARREGRGADAAKGLERFIRDSASDARAPVAAFELGRIRMDSLGDARGAAQALELSLRLDSNASFREEAMSRLVRAYEQLGDAPACAAARDAYLSAFPSGAYARSVQARCGSRP